MSYKLRGLGLDLTMEQCSPNDFACVQRNVARGDILYNAGKPTLGYDPNDFIGRPAPSLPAPPSPYTVLGLPAPAAAAPPPAAPISGGRLAFTSSRGSNSLQVGDTWLVSITGASPNMPVTVSGSMPSGAFSGSAMGSTDGAGNFSKAGAVSAADIGNWAENWAVGGVSSGAVSFSVSAKPAPVPGVVLPAPAPAPAPGGSTLVLPVVAGFDLGSIPWWGWAGAAGLAFLAFGKGGR